MLYCKKCRFTAFLSCCLRTAAVLIHANIHPSTTFYTMHYTCDTLVPGPQLGKVKSARGPWEQNLGLKLILRACSLQQSLYKRGLIWYRCSILHSLQFINLCLNSNSAAALNSICIFSFLGFRGNSISTSTSAEENVG